MQSECFAAVEAEIKAQIKQLQQKRIRFDTQQRATSGSLKKKAKSGIVFVEITTKPKSNFRILGDIIRIINLFGA